MSKIYHKSNYQWHTLFSIAFLLLLASCAKDVKKEEMPLSELSEKALAALENKKRDVAIEYLEQIIYRFPDHQHIAQYKILLAEQYFKKDRYAEAQELYDHYSQFYPSDTRAEYAKYKSILAMYHQTLRHDCDQTETEKTILLCHEYLQNLTYAKYQKDVFDIQNTCENKLIDKEVYVFNFYLKRGEIAASRNRLTYLKEKFSEKHPELSPRLLYLECKLAKHEKNDTIVTQNLSVLKQKYPASQYTNMAKGLAEHKDYFFF